MLAPTSSQQDANDLNSEHFISYSTWRGLLHSYSTLKNESPAIADVKRLSYLRRQIIWHYFKNFFYFPIWFLKFLIPAHFKGKINLWTNLKTIAKSSEFKPLRMAVVTQLMFLYVIGQLGFIIFYKNAIPTFAATYTWIQSSWSGGASTTASAIHPTNQTAWNKYYSASSTISTGATVTLAAVAASTTQTTDSDFNVGSFSSTEISGSGSAAGVVLTGSTTAINSWDTGLKGIPGNIGYGSTILRNGSSDDIYVLAGNNSTNFYKYSISTGLWTTLTSVPGSVGSGGSMVWDGVDTIYVLRGNTQTGFYKYSISGNSWTTLTSITAGPSTGGSMIWDSSENFIYVLRGNSQTSFYRYSISGNSWTTLTSVPGTVGAGAQMIRNGTDNDIYVLRGNSQTSTYKYSISGNSWTVLKGAPGTVSDGGWMLRNGSDNDIYVLGGGTGFYKYSISGNSWTTLTVVPVTVGVGVSAVRNSSDNDIYVMAGNISTSFYKYSISGNSWTALTAVPATVESGGFMIRNSSDNDMYVLRGNTTNYFFKYSISGNSWIGSHQSNLTSVPGAVTDGSSMLRNSSDDDVYVLSGGAVNFYKYSISGNSWTSLASTPLAVALGSQMIRNGSDNEIYALRGSNGAFYRYSISGNTWTSLTSVPSNVGPGSSMIRNGSDDDIYVLPGNSLTSFYRYSISGNSWTTLTSVPAAVATGGSMIRNGSDNDIYVVRGNSTSFYRYSISGNSWTTLTVAPGTISTGSTMIRNGSDDLIYVTQANNSTSLYKYSISGNSWTTTAAPGTIGLGSTMIRNGSDDYIYISGGQVTGGFYRYSISGDSWTTLSTLSAAVSSGSRMIRNGSDNEFYLLQGNSATGFFKYILNQVTYSTSGTFTSSVIDTSGTTGFTTLSYTSSTPSNTTLTVDVRAGDTATPDGTWTSWQTSVSNGGSISGLGAKRYIQYRANLATSNTGRTPTFSDSTLGYSQYTSGSFISSPYNATDVTNVVGSIAWSATTPTSTSVKFQVRTSADNTTYSNWVGPDGTASTYFTAADGSQDMPAVFNDSTNDQWMQYRATLTGSGSDTPTLSGITLSYVVNAPPDIFIVTSTPVSESSTGLVSFSYQVRDLDTASGVTPGLVSVDLQYCTSNCASAGNEVWATAATSSLTGTFGPSISVSGASYNTYSLVWDPVNSYPNQYNGSNFKIRLRANDSEAANNMGYVESDTFVLDTKDPVVSMGIDGRSDAPYNLTIGATDDTSAGRQMKLSNNSDLSSDGLNGSSGTWIPYAATTTWDFAPGGTTIYYQVRDAFGNVSANGAISSAQTPAVPAQIVYRDVSNADTSEWREFIAWGIIADPTPGFDHYTVWRSTDGTNYTQLTTESDRLINYHLDDNLNTDTTYYYKVTAEDADGNISNYSNIVNDKPNGQGGSDVTAPTISNVSSTALGPQSAIITWDTDELSDSLVDYTIEQGGDFSSVDTVGITAMYDSSLGLGQHVVVLTDLQPNTTYYFQVRSHDPSDNEGVGTSAPDGYSFTTLLGPSISDVGVSDITNETVTINWVTDEAVNSYVHYSTDPAFASSTRVGSDVTANDHSVTLYNLVQGTTYYYYVESGISTDKHVVDGEIIYYTFTTTADVDAPDITFDPEADVTVSDIEINFSWVTDEAATSTVEYGTSEEYGTVLFNNNLNVDHIFKLEDLLPGTLYYIRFRSADENGNLTSATEFTATTIDTADYDAPVISNVEASVVTDDEALIAWDTDEGTTGRVHYGTTSGTYNEQSDLVSSYNRAHAITISGLTTSTQYYYVVVSGDSSGNTATSSEYSFTTLEQLSQESEVQLREEAARAAGVAAGEANTHRGGSSGGTSVDRTAPILSNISVSDISDTSAVISWSSDEIGDSIVEFGLTTDYTRAAVNLEDSATHRISLIDLKPETTYSYRVSTADTTGNRSKFTGGTFTTLSTLEDITNIPEKVPDVSGAEAENLFVASIEKATDIIRALSSQVSVGVLESNLLRQAEVIQELSTLLPLPIIGGQPVVETGSNYVSISWTTDKLSNSLVEYAPADEYLLTDAYAQTVGNFDISTNAHTVEIRGLLPNTLYHYRVGSRTPTGAETKSRDFTFRTKTEFSEISNYKTQVMSPQEASFFWATNLPTNSMISYTPYRAGSPDTAATKISRQADYKTEHLTVLSDLEAGVVYDIELSGTDYGGNTVSKLIKGFSTNGTDVPPVIYQIQTDSAIIPGAKEKIQVIISWVTNELATSRVLYRKGFASDDTAFTDATVLDPEYVKKHVVVVSNFDSGQVYQFAVESTDSGGNTAVSKIITILTPQKEQSVFQVIMSNVEDIFSWTGNLRR